MSYSPSNPSSIIPVTTHYRSAYSPKIKVGLTFPEESLTKQEFKDECDINVLMSRYMATGELPNLNEREPQYLDTTGHDYQVAMNLISGANSLFHEMPSKIRNRFANDPAAFLDFCSDEKNREEMASLGLLRPREEWLSAPIEFGDKVPQNPSGDAGAEPEK